MIAPNPTLSTPHPPEGAANGAVEGFWREVLAVIRTVLLALVLALLVRVVFYQPFTIPSASMEPGLVEGDYLMVSKFSYGWSRASLPFSPPVFRGRVFGPLPERGPQRGDVIVFKSESTGQAIIKRVIGVPGDRVQLRGGQVILNGAPLPQAVIGAATDATARAAVVRETGPAGRSYPTLDRGPGHDGDDTGAYLVPTDRYFVLGDNRDNSLDSRWPAGFGVGLVPAEAIVGEAQLILLSWKPGASLFKPWTWFSLQLDRTLTRVT